MPRSRGVGNTSILEGLDYFGFTHMNIVFVKYVSNMHLTVWRFPWRCLSIWWLVFMWSSVYSIPQTVRRMQSIEDSIFISRDCSCGCTSPARMLAPSLKFLPLNILNRRGESIYPYHHSPCIKSNSLKTYHRLPSSMHLFRYIIWGLWRSSVGAHGDSRTSVL